MMFVFISVFSVSTSGLTGNSQLWNEECRNGFNCTRGQENPAECPAGFLCPNGSANPIPCPEGTFRSAGASAPPRTCTACPANFFNAKIGQQGCFPCGSEAAQPTEGQNTCICLWQGRIFQPSDSQCPCAPGYRSLSEDRRWDCIKQAYDICRDGAVRSQDGRCLTKEEWTHHCSEQVCAASGDYQGYDNVLGLCLCQAGSLDGICNWQCQGRQRHILQLVCGQEPARLSMAYRNGSKANILLEGLRASLQAFDVHAKTGCSSENQDPQPVYVVKANGSGFLGVYDPEPEMLQHYFTSNHFLPASQNALQSSKSFPRTSAKGESRVYQPEPSNSTQEVIFFGILNPTVCLKMQDVLLFIVSKDHYPVYDVNNLYNTNRDFDWGAFRRLAEEMRLASSSAKSLVFFYQFPETGTYVLRLSGQEHKKMYIRVLPYGAQCYKEGPFFPTTPNYIVQMGIAKIPDLLLKPDWPAIVGTIMGLIFLLLTCLLMIGLCQAFGWARKQSSIPRFRKLQLKYDLDKYSSRESKVVAIQKDQSGRQAQSCLEKNSDRMEMAEDQFKIWAVEERIDLESFNTNAFFEILLRQSLAVTTKLSQFKEELKTVYFKLLDETAFLRDLWVEKMCTPDVGQPCTKAIMGNYTEARKQAEEEIECRRRRAAEYEESLCRQINSLTRDLKGEEGHWVAFNSALREAVRLMEMPEDAFSREDLDSSSNPNHQRLLGLIDVASAQLSSVVMKESHRLMQWGILREGTGAGLLNEESGGSLKAHEVLHLDEATGLIMPNKGAVMLLANQSLNPTSHHFLHPGTGKLLPVAGNVGFDLTRSKLIPVVDLAAGDLHHSEFPIFSFVPYPISPSTGLPARLKLPVLRPEKVFKLGGLMQDPVTGMEVPILAVTVHPQTGQVLTLGGTYLNPLTGMVAPLEMGGPMKAPEGGEIVPILGVGLDHNTGGIIPVGGLRGPSGDLLLPGDPFLEPLSGKTARLQGLSLQQEKVVPHAGGYQVVLDAHVLLTQLLVAEALLDYKDALCKGLCPPGTEQKGFKAAETAMRRSLSQKLDSLMYQLQRLEKLQGSALRLKSTGGKLGMIKYLSTELWIPAVFGMKIPDPGGSELRVPILGVECDWKTGQPIPVAGVTEDANGKGLVPITVGFKAIDPITGELGPVIGAQMDPWTKAVFPVIQSQGSLPRENIDTDLLAALGKEISARQVYRQSQREKEELLLKEVDCLWRDILEVAREGKMRKLKYRDRLKAADRICHLLESTSAQEIQRQTDRDRIAPGNPKRCPWSRVNKDERDQEAKVQFLLRKALEKLVQFVQKVQLEEGRIQMHLKGMEQRWGRTFCTKEAIKERFGKTLMHLVAEFQDHVAKQQARMETEYCRLEYLRFLSHIVALQTKDHLSESAQCFVNYPGVMFYSMAASPQGSWEVINQKLVPLLKSVMQTLEENKGGPSSPVMLLSLESGGSSPRSTLKMSEAVGDALRTKTKQDGAPTPDLLPKMLHFPSMSRSQLLQEIQTRLFLEKHASEMVRLQLSLMAEEIHMISCFWESSQLETTEGKEGKRTLGLVSDWNHLLKELAEHHRRTEGDFAQRQREERQRAGLCLWEVNFSDSALFPLEEILQRLSLLSADLQRVDSAKGNREASGSEATHGTDPAAQQIQAMAVKLVKEEALKLVRVYQVLDAYHSLQKQSCPRDVLEALDQLHYTITGEAVSQDVACRAETHLAEGAKAFIQKSLWDGGWLLSFQEANEAELMGLRAQIQMELRAWIEEALETKEMEVIQEAAHLAPGFPLRPLTFFLLAQRHLRQSALLLGGGLKTPQADEPSAEKDLETIFHLLEGMRECEGSLLEMQQAVLMVQLKERQLQEMVQVLKAPSSEQDLEDAKQIANQLKELRRQKMKEVVEQIKMLLPAGQKPRKEASKDFLWLQSERSSLEKVHQEKKGEEEMWKEFQFQEHLEDFCRENVQEEKAERQDLLKRGEIKKWSRQQPTKEHGETRPFLGKIWKQDLHGERLEKKKEMASFGPADGSSLIAEMSSSQGQEDKSGLEEERVLPLLAEKTKILKQMELLVTLRLVLLNPHFKPLPPDDNEVSNGMSSQLFTLLKEVNAQFEKYAADLGLRDIHRQEHGTDNSFQDIMVLQILPKMGELVPLLASSLSAREFVVYQYGIILLQFLQPCIGAPEVELRVASSIPSSHAPENAFRNAFYYQTSGHQLFVLREYLNCVGSFALLLIHCLAHIAANDFSHDSSPAFRRLFYQALKACLGEMFSLRLQASLALDDDKSAATMLSKSLQKGEEASAQEGLHFLPECKAKDGTNSEKDVSRAAEPQPWQEIEDLQWEVLGGQKP